MKLEPERKHTMTDAIQDAIAQAQKTAQASIAAQAGAVATASHPASTTSLPCVGAQPCPCRRC